MTKRSRNLGPPELIKFLLLKAYALYWRQQSRI